VSPRGYYRQFEELSDEEISADLRKVSDERRRLALARVDPIDLSVSTWHQLPHPDVVSAITYAARGGINRDPDPSALELRRDLGHRHAVGADRIAVANGAAELLRAAVAGLLRPGDELLTPWPSYPVAPLLARTLGATPVPVAGLDAGALAAAVTERTRLLVVTTPNDPTGEHLEPGELGGLVAGLPERVTVVVDAALADYLDDDAQNEITALVDEHPQLVVLRTFSKGYGLAGLRCGYAIGGPGSEDLLAKLAPSLGVSGLTQAGAREALHKCGPLVNARRAAVANERARLLGALRELPVDVSDSDANVLWLQAPSLRDGELVAGLAARKVITFDGAALGEPGHVRATIRDEAAGDRLLRALKGVLGITNGDGA
jgi:histidinol-phosphate aminotransferase